MIKSDKVLTNWSVGRVARRVEASEVRVRKTGEKRSGSPGALSDAALSKSPNYELFKGERAVKR